MKSSAYRPGTTSWRCALALLTLAVGGCWHPPTKGQCGLCFERHLSDPEVAVSSDCRPCVEIRARDPREHDPHKLRSLYAEEYAYIESRRRAVTQSDNAAKDQTPATCATAAPPGNVEPTATPCASWTPTPPPTVQSGTPATSGLPPGLPPNLIGLSLSGGGIRSASISLGALQALNDMGVFRQVDYMSAVSGGGYISGWLQAHLGAANLPSHDRYAYDVAAADANELLANHGDHVEHLRTHTGFLNRGGWWGEVGTMAGEWLKRWPFHVVMDDVIHWRGRDPWYHILPIYEERIQGTYFRGEPDRRRALHPVPQVQLADINAPDRADLSPYLIINGNLTNVGKSQIHVKPMYRKAWNFEFTRDFVGSDGTGYVATRGFGLPVNHVYRDSHDQPVFAVLDEDAPDASAFRLSKAVAAGGAAFDSQTAIATRLNWPVLGETLQGIGGGVFNLYLGLDVPNFARTYNGAASIWDYTRMVTYQRLPRLVDTGARWLYVTDGGFYENLGVLALLRRGVSCVIAVDATADAARSYDDLQTLRRRVETDLDLVWTTELPSAGADVKAAYRFEVDDHAGNTRAVILYLKPSADPELRHLRDVDWSLQQLRHAYDVIVDNLFAQLQWGNPPPALEQAIDRYFTEAREAPLRARSNQTSVEALKSKIAASEAKLIAAEAKAYAPKRDTDKALAAEEMAVPTPAGAGEPAAPIVSREAYQVNASLEQKADDTRRELQELRRQLAREKDLSHDKMRDVCDRQNEIHSIVAHLATAALARNSRDQEATACALQRFDAASQRVEARVERLVTDAAGARLQDAARVAAIDRINAFSSHSRSFPHDSTVKQAYEWERFEAYRLLGYQTTKTYLSELFPSAGQNQTDERGLQWCNFALPDDTKRSMTPATANPD